MNRAHTGSRGNERRPPLNGTIPTPAHPELMRLRRLWAAVIRQVVEEAGGPPKLSRTAQARHYIQTASFDRVCDLAGLDPSHIRRLLRHNI